VKVTRSRLKEIIKEELRLLKESNIISEDGHTDVPSARRKMKTSVEDAMQILQGLEAMPDEGELPSWWMGKVTLAADYLNKARDYFLVSETKEAGVPEDRRKNLLFRLTKFTRDNDLRKRVAEVVMLALSDAKELGIEEVEQVFRNKFKDPSFLTKVKGEKPIPLEEIIKEELSQVLNENPEVEAAAKAVISTAERKGINLKQLETQDGEKFAKTVSELLSTMVFDDVDDISVEEEIKRILGV
jgi:hypothetical protein